jgi:hypothetical protein
MAKTKAKSKADKSSETKNGRGRRSTRLFERVQKESPEIIREAALLLDEELAAGIVAAKKMHRRFQEERRIDPADFKDALQRLQSDAHEVVTILNQQVTQMSSKENTEVVTRLISNSHGLIDLLVGFVDTGVDVANQLIEANLPKQGRRAK